MEITTTLNFDTRLVQKINYLLGSDPQSGQPAFDDKFHQNLVGRKALLLSYALVNYENLLGKNTSSMKAYGLDDMGASFYSTKLGSGSKAPNYFQTLLPMTPLSTTSVDYDATAGGRYDYRGTSDGKFWVDFANSTLGGGVFTDGFLQEETMFLETPELANAAAQTKPLVTRTGGSGPLNGSPTPLIFLGANRVMAIVPELAVAATKGDRTTEHWRTFSVAELIKDDVPLDKSQKINVLSMAAPNLHLKTPHDQWKDQATMEVLEDLFNTFYAGFTMAKKAYPSSPILINTGPIGAGGFTNNKVVVNVMQQLAAIVVSQQTGPNVVNLKFWGYGDAGQPANKEAEDAVKAIIKDFNGPGTTKTISKLLEIAQPWALTLAHHYPTPK